MVENKSANSRVVTAMGAALALSGVTLFSIGAARIPDNIFPSDTTENAHNGASVSNRPEMQARHQENDYPSLSSQIALEAGVPVAVLGASIVLLSRFYNDERENRTSNPLNQ